MSDYPHTMVVVASEQMRDTCIAMAAALGYAAGLSVPLSATGEAPATHYGLHTWAGPEFTAIMTGQVTPEIDGYTAQNIADLLAAITVSVDPPSGATKRTHFNEVIADLGLTVIQPEDTP